MTQQQEHTPLYSDTRIGRVCVEMATLYGDAEIATTAMFIMQDMRDNYERHRRFVEERYAAAHAEVESLKAERDELNATLDEKARSHAELLIAWYKLTGDWDRVTQENAELRRGQYVPLADGEYTDLMNRKVTIKDGGKTLWVYGNDYDSSAREWYEYILDSEMQDGARLCRLAPQQDALTAMQQYVKGHTTIVATRDEWNQRYVDGWTDGNNDARDNAAPDAAKE